MSRAPDVSALEAGETPRRAQEEALRREQRAERRKAARRERALRWAKASRCDETLLEALKASAGEE